MTGLFNIHTVVGSLSPKQSEQERERAVCFLPVERVSSSEPGGLRLSSLLHPQMVVSHPWAGVSSTTLKAAVIYIFILTLD